MAKIVRSENIDRQRRQLFGVAAVTLAASQFGPAGASVAPAPAPAAAAGFGPLQQVSAGPLAVAYVDAGPPDGPPVLLLHGWPYDIHSFIDVVPRLAARGF